MSAEKSQRITELLGLSVSPSKVRSYVDKYWINKAASAGISQQRDQLAAIKKSGCPIAQPVAPERLSSKATLTEKGEHKKNRASYEKELKEYNKYVSDEYVKLEMVHHYYRDLARFASLLDHKKVLPTGAAETATELQAVLLNGTDKKTYITVSSKQFQDALKANLLESVDAMSTGVVACKLEQERLLAAFPSLKLFLDKDTVSADKLRFNGSTSVVAAVVIQMLLTQYAAAAIQNACEDDAKTVKPENCIDNDNISLLPLVLRAPHYVAVRNRAARRNSFYEDKEEARSKAIQQAKAKARREKSKYKAPAADKSTFEESEVELGFAVTKQVDVRVKEGEVAKTKTKYSWYNIEIERTPTDFHFDGTAEKIAREALDDAILTGVHGAARLRLGSSFIKHLDGLVRDIIAEITPTALLFTEKTVTEKTVTAVFKSILISSYEEKTPNTTLSEDHDHIFDLVQSKVDAYNAYKLAKAAAVKKTSVTNASLSSSPIEEEDEFAETVPTNKSISELKSAVAQLNGKGKTVKA
jgi:hypothetical protein